MNTLNPLGFQEANENSKEIFTSHKNKIGMVPNLYAPWEIRISYWVGF